jgi:hypothetical protein
VTEPFEAAWHRIDRAEAHRAAAAEVWNTWIEDEAYDYSLFHEGEGKFSLTVYQESPAPPEMAVLIGEWLYNLRCALDYAIYDTAICDSGKNPPPGAGQLQMPIYFDKSQYRDNEYRLKPLDDFHRTALIEFMQPYRHDDPDTSALGWLHKLARIDRHRSLHVMTAYAAEMSPEIRGVPDSCTIDMTSGERIVVNRQAEIARFTITPWDDSWKVEVNPQTGLDPEIAEWAASPFWRQIPYNERLRMLDVAVKSIVVPLEYDCTGYSRKAKLLTDDFRAECDARRKKRPNPRLGSPSRDW